MPYPVLLGLDWLKCHNPVVDWARGQLSLSCCGTAQKFPVQAFGKGYDLISPSLSSNPSSMFSVGLGLGLNNLRTPSFVGRSDLSDKLFLDSRTSMSLSENASTSSRAGLFLESLTRPSILRPPVPTGLGCAELFALWLAPLASKPTADIPTAPIDIQIVEPERFHKYTKNSPINCIWYTPNKGVEAHINLLYPEPIPPEPPPISIPDNSISDPDEDVKKIVPEKYHGFIDIFSPIEVKWLPDHRPYDIDIELEEGKTPPFGPIYSLSTEERKALFDYVEENLAKGFI